MMRSARLTELEGRVQDLRNHLLPPEFDAIGIYENEDRVTIHTLSFRVLAHAEIEVYFEDRIIEIAKAAWKSWQKTAHVSRVAFSLLAFCGREMKRPPQSLAAPNPNKEKYWREQLDIGERLKFIVQQFVRSVQNDNHGVREKNLLSMLLPIGFDHCDLDEIFVANIDNFGKLRGEAAHSSTSTPQVRQSVDPKAEYEQVSNLVANLQAVDVRLDQILLDARGVRGESMGATPHGPKPAP